MSRTAFYIIAIFVISNFSCSENQNSNPNILLINIDDMGWKDLGFMGSDYYVTPHIDALAEQGMVFTNGYAAAANCAPSRACLMTGKWATRHGIYTVGNSDRGKPQDRKLIPTENITTLSKAHLVIPEFLKSEGYITCQAGKWHLSKNPLDYSFDLTIGGGHNGHPRSYYPPYGNVILEAPDGTNLTDLIMKKAIQFVDTVSKPFFLYYSPYAVHTPIQPIEKLLSNYEGKASTLGQDNPNYATMVENLDRNIGLLISALKSKGQYKNTMIIFTSDNGGLYGITRQPPLRAGKGSYYEGGIREPFFVTWAGKVAPGSSSDEAVTNIDIFPTLLDVVNPGEQLQDLDGQNLMPILLKKEKVADRALFWHFPIYLQAYNVHDNENRDSLFRTRPGSVVRYNEWKLHYYFEDDGVELYNLNDDIGERNNLAEELPDKKKEMLELLENWWQQTNAPIPKELNPEYTANQ